MDHIIICPNCKYLYNTELVVPKVLRCGHTLCLLCLTERLASCITCDTPITESCDDTPTNEAILSVLRSEKQLEYRRSQHYELIKSLKSKYKYKLTSLLETQEKLNIKLNEVHDRLHSLESFDLQNYNKEFLSIQKFCANGSHSLAYWKIRSTISFQLNCQSSSVYLSKIYNCLLQEKEVFSVQFIDNKFQYGKISFSNDWILFHSLAFLEVPKTAETIWFQDLKQCITRENFNTFLVFPRGSKRITETVVIEPMDSWLAQRFIKFCTGEFGSSYKGCSFSKQNFNYFYFRGWDPCNEIDENDENSDVKIGKVMNDFEYFKNSKILFDFGENDVIVKSCPNGFIKLIKCFGETKCQNVVGRVVSTIGLDSLVSTLSSEPNIVDCGIMIQV